MKQIFDWLREQINSVFRLTDSYEFLDSRVVFSIIDEAEAKCSDIEQDAYQRGYVLGFDNGYKDGQFFEKAKWEAECCEWKPRKAYKVGYCYTTGCGKERTHTLGYDSKYCEYCGKPIKISEVE